MLRQWEYPLFGWNCNWESVASYANVSVGENRVSFSSALQSENEFLLTIFWLTGYLSMTQIGMIQ
jgi:hypothetical protein